MLKSVVTRIIVALLVLLAASPAIAEQEQLLLDGKSICIDAGHGGPLPGAVFGADGIYLEEKNINLDVAWRLRTLLEQDGATVFMTRVDDSDLSNDERYTVANENEVDIFVSVHTNSVLLNPETRDGSMALYFDSPDQELARLIYDVMYESLREDAQDADITFTDYGASKFASRILMSSTMPATLLEPVCMSNPTEALWLDASIHVVDEDGVVVLGDGGKPTKVDAGPSDHPWRRNDIATSIQDGILAYFESAPTGGDEPGAGPPCDQPPCKGR